MKKMIMLLCFAVIAAATISCDSKAKKEAEESIKQEALYKQQEEARIQEAQERQSVHDEFVKRYSREVYHDGRSAGYRLGRQYGPYRKDEWYEENLRINKSIWLHGDELTKEYIKEIEKEYKNGFNEGWEMALSEK